MFVCCRLLANQQSSSGSFINKALGKKSKKGAAASAPLGDNIIIDQETGE